MAQTFEGEMHLAHAQRDLLYEVAEVLVGLHDYERHDGRVWCIECRYEFPCKTRQMADHAIRGVSELGPINRV